MWIIPNPVRNPWAILKCVEEKQTSSRNYILQSSALSGTYVDPATFRPCDAPTHTLHQNLKISVDRWHVQNCKVAPVIDCSPPKKHLHRLGEWNTRVNRRRGARRLRTFLESSGARNRLEPEASKWSQFFSNVFLKNGGRRADTTMGDERCRYRSEFTLVFIGPRSRFGGKTT